MQLELGGDKLKLKASSAPVAASAAVAVADGQVGLDHISAPNSATLRVDRGLPAAWIVGDFMTYKVIVTQTGSSGRGAPVFSFDLAGQPATVSFECKVTACYDVLKDTEDKALWLYKYNYAEGRRVDLGKWTLSADIR